MGLFLSNYKYDQDTQRLFVSGPALEEGVWVGMSGVPTFYPKDVIQRGAFKFEGCDLVCEHLGKVIGQVVSVELTDNGFAVKEAYIWHKASIDAILSGEKRGFSIEAIMFIDPITRIAEEIVKAINISLVATPACKVCGITRAYKCNIN